MSTLTLRTRRLRVLTHGIGAAAGLCAALAGGFAAPSLANGEDYDCSQILDTARQAFETRRQTGREQINSVFADPPGSAYDAACVDQITDMFEEAAGGSSDFSNYPPDSGGLGGAIGGAIIGAIAGYVCDYYGDEYQNMVTSQSCQGYDPEYGVYYYPCPQ